MHADFEEVNTFMEIYSTNKWADTQNKKKDVLFLVLLSIIENIVKMYPLIRADLYTRKYYVGDKKNIV